MSSTADAHVAFVHELHVDDVPAPVRAHVRRLLADLAAVCVAGRPAPASAMAADYASTVHPGDEAAALYDGRRLGAVGAAWANGVLANVLDLDDGHRLTKGHPGAVIIPAALAAAQRADATFEEFVTAILVGYEVAVRAGVVLHARDDAYHASGAWGGLGAAAAAARLLGLGAEPTRHAISLAEYHAPIAPIMRSVAEPAMTKDACAWGASVGVSSALMAAGGFTAVQAEYLDTDPTDLGERWCVEELYVKAYPCCRWSQGGIRAALEAVGGEAVDAATVEGIEIRTFAAADALAKGRPATTEEAQYSLLWPVAQAVAHGDFRVEDVLGPWEDAAVARLAECTTVVVDDELTAAFPARRLTAVEITLSDGRRLAAGPLEARGEPGSSDWNEVVSQKVARLVGQTVPAGATDSRLGTAGPDELVALLCAQVGVRDDA